jgi:HTH-type transcriptional regulator / antitoxin HigA
MTPKVIKAEAEYEATMARIDQIIQADAGTPEGDELELLTLLVENYEKAAYPMPVPQPQEALRFRMEQLGLQPKDLVPFLGGASRVSEVLNGRRSLSLAMIRRLVSELGMPPLPLLGVTTRQRVPSVPAPKAQ